MVMTADMGGFDLREGADGGRQTCKRVEAREAEPISVAHLSG